MTSVAKPTPNSASATPASASNQVREGLGADAFAPDEQSVRVVTVALRRQPLPPGLAVMRPAVRWGYFIYGLACSLLGLLAFVMSVVWIGYWLYALLKGFLL